MGREDWGSGRALGLLLMQVGTGKRWHSLGYGNAADCGVGGGVYFQSD